MENKHLKKFTKIGVFYDGNYFSHVSAYYNQAHPRRARLDLNGLHAYIRSQVAKEEGCDERFCKIIDTHYFRGRLKTSDPRTNTTAIIRERCFDDVLIQSGVSPHYLPMGPEGEKGIDVLLSLEAYEMTLYKGYDVVVLVAGDGDFVPLLRKLHGLGARSMLLGWNIHHVDDSGQVQDTSTSSILVEAANYPIIMSSVIDDDGADRNGVVKSLFLKSLPAVPCELPIVKKVTSGRQCFIGKILSVNVGKAYGFIQPVDVMGDSPDEGNRFFHFNEVSGGAKINWGKSVGMVVEYTPYSGNKGPAARVLRVVQNPSQEFPHISEFSEVPLHAA